MKKIVILFLVFTCNSFSQFKVNYKEIQSKYSPLDSEESFIETKSVNDLEQVLFHFSKKDSTLLSVNFKHLESYTENDFLNIVNEYIIDYKPSKIKEWENWTLYYDEKNKIIVVKVFENHLKSKIKDITMINDKRTVESMLKLFEVKFSH
jgi:hypothetical protein